MAGETASACNARGDLSYTHVVLNSLYDYFTRKYGEVVAEDDMDRYVFDRAYTQYHGGELRSCANSAIHEWTEQKPLPFFVTRVYDVLVEKGELPHLEVRSVADAVAEASSSVE